LIIKIFNLLYAGDNASTNYLKVKNIFNIKVGMSRLTLNKKGIGG